MKTNSTSIKTPTALRVLAFFELALIAVTWRLWSATSNVPRVPLVPVSFPDVVFLTASFTLAAGCGLILLEGVFSTMRRPVAGWLTWIAGCVCVIANQQCLQAWHWLFLISLWLWLLTNEIVWPRVMRHVVCSIYICSALSRMTLTPESGMTAVIARQLLQWAGASEFQQSDLLASLCHGLSLGEFSIGFLLLFTRTRVVGILLAELLHIILLTVLGPSGLNHHAGVLIWNLCLIVLVPIVFSSAGRGSASSVNSSDDGTRDVRVRFRFAGGLLLIWVWPLSGLVGFADNWPSWQLYSNRPESLSLFVKESEINLLPNSVRRWVGDVEALGELRPVRLDRWMLDEIGSPMYPEDRFQLAIIQWCVRGFPESSVFEVRISEPELLWWQRAHRVLRTSAELENEQRRFFWNSFVR